MSFSDDGDLAYTERRLDEIVTVLEGRPTKRELFAAMAMQGFCSLSPSDYEYWHLDGEVIAKMSVEQADALLAELSKEKKP